MLYTVDMFKLSFCHVYTTNDYNATKVTFEVASNNYFINFYNTSARMINYFIKLVRLKLM